MTRSRKRKLARNRAKWAGMPLASAILASGGAAYAAADTEQATLEEVVVTAQKRSEDLQKVPISLQVLSSEKLEQLQVTSFDDYAKFLPSLSYKSLGPSQAELFFRGISSGGGGLHAGYLPTTGLYLDEIPVTTIAGSLDLHVYDIARVEALAGPQGTLYGASSLSGTLRIITNKPDPTGFSAGYDVKGDKWKKGNGGGGIEGYVNIPLAEHAAIRLVGYYEHIGGYINNVFREDTFQRFSVGGIPTSMSAPDGYPDFAPVTVNNAGVQRRHYNDVDNIGGRAALKVDLNDQWSITPALIYQHQRTHGDFGFDPKFGDLNSADYYLPRNLDRWYQSELTVEGKISNWDVVYSGGYFERKIDNLVDYSQYSIAYDQKSVKYNAAGYQYTRFLDAAGHLLDNVTQYTANRDKYTKMSHELRISSPADSRVRGVAGLFYQRQTDNIRAEFDLPNLPVYYEVTGQKNVYYLSQQDRADRDYAVFGDVTFDVTDKLKVSGGIREFWVNNTLYGFFGFNNDGYSGTGEDICEDSGIPILTTPGVYTGGNRPCINTNKKTVENGETHKINVTYQIDPDRMVYGTWSTGFRPGGNNRRPEALKYQADTLANFELGWKTAWFDRRVRLNGAVFYEKWKDAQTSIQGQFGITSIVNAGAARTEGLESDVSWLIGDHLTLSASGTGLLKSEITTNFCHPTAVGAAVTNCTGAGIDAVAGTQLPITPKVKVNGTARYRFNVMDYDSFVQGSVVHQSSTTYSLEAFPNQLVGNTPGYTTFDVSAGTGMHNWHVEAYIENLFDKRASVARISECADTPYGYCWSNAKEFVVNPMNFGVKFGQKF
jgi:iron complex outermembrane recepter protein